jgi:hypothetical protein
LLTIGFIYSLSDLSDISVPSQRRINEISSGPHTQPGFRSRYFFTAKVDGGQSCDPDNFYIADIHWRCYVAP